MKKRIYKKYRKFLHNYLGFNGYDVQKKQWHRRTNSYNKVMNHSCVLFDKRYKAKEIY